MTRAESYRPLAERMLAETPDWQRLDAAARVRLLDSGSLRRHAAGVNLHRRGEPMTELVFVVTGNLEVSVQGVDGRRAVCWYVEPGQFIGVVPLLDGLGGIHDVIVHTEAVVLHVPKEAFLSALRDEPALVMAIVRILCDRTRTLYELLAASALQTLRTRTARMIMLLADRHGRQREGRIELDLRLSQDDLADMLGVSRQSLNRELKALEANGVVSLAYSRIAVADAAQLERIARGDA